MEIIVGSILAIFVVGALVVLVVVNRKKAKEEPAKEPSAPASDCCGAHEVCEVDQLKMDPTRIDYYDDEELDKLANIEDTDYLDEQIDEIREVLYTLKTEEIRYWLISIERRHINLPSILQEEARMLMAEA